MTTARDVTGPDGFETAAGNPAGPAAPEATAGRTCCPVEKLIRRFACSAPSDAADRLLAGLTPEKVTGELQRAELDTFARRALWPSIFLAVFAVAAALGSLLHGRHHRPHGPPGPGGAPGDGGLALGSEAAFEAEAERVALPFDAAPRERGR